MNLKSSKSYYVIVLCYCEILILVERFFHHVVDAEREEHLLATNYFPAINLCDGDYKLGLAIFEIYHTIPNVNESNNKFYFAKDDAEITISEGSYEVRDIFETCDFTEMSVPRA